MPGRRAPPLTRPAAPARAEAQGAPPVGDDEFASQMAACGPFEPAPLLAVAVSGGGDSLALLFLADGWARARGGSVLALTVDHALRAGSAVEAAQVAALCAARGIAHRTLLWKGSKPATRIQERAREARYALLEAACAEAGVLHLLLAHHAEDQAETIALRTAAGTGPRGAAGMARLSFRGTARFLRPLLALPKARLLSTCRAAGLVWIEDPSNADPRYARARLRAGGAAALPADAPERAAARGAADTAASALGARLVLFDGAGFARLDRGGLAAAPDDTAALLLSQVVRAVGAAAHPLPPALQAGLLAWVRTGALGGDARSRVTAGRCVLALRRETLLIAREARRLPPPVALAPGAPTRWDRRVLACAAAPGLVLGALGPGGWERARAAGIDLPPLPAEARASLPVVRSAGGQIVGWLGQAADDAAGEERASPSNHAEIHRLAWVSTPPAFPAAFTVVWPPRRIMF